MSRGQLLPWVKLGSDIQTAGEDLKKKKKKKKQKLNVMQMEKSESEILKKAGHG